MTMLGNATLYPSVFRATKRDVLSGCLIAALKDGYGWCRLTTKIKDSNGVRYNHLCCPVVALIGKLLNESFYARLNMFIDWNYLPAIGYMTCSEMEDVKISLFREREFIAADIQKKVNRRLYDIVNLNRQEAITLLNGIGEEIKAGTVCTLED